MVLGIAVSKRHMGRELRAMTTHFGNALNVENLGHSPLAQSVVS